MSEFLEWLALLSPWSIVLVGWAVFTLCGVMFVAWPWFLRTEPGQPVARWVCRRFDHDWLADERARPVTAFNVCLRCGKIGDRLP